MTVVGFIDTTGRGVRFEDMHKGEGQWDLPLPMLRAFSRFYRGASHYGDHPNSVSVTTIIGPPRIAHLKQRHETFVHPEDGWQSGLGTLAHGLFEADPKAGELVEQKLVVERHGVQLGGTFDLLVGSDGMMDNAVGWDYKIAGSYSIKQMMAGEIKWNGSKADYFWQAQLLKYLAEQPDVMQVVERPVSSELLHGRVKTEKELIEWPHRGIEIVGWNIQTLARDWTKRSGFASPLNTIPVAPLMENDRIDNYLKQRAALYLAAEMCEDNDLPECTDEEVWGYLAGGQGRRCSQWCEVAGVCNQNRRNLGLGN